MLRKLLSSFLIAIYIAVSSGIALPTAAPKTDLQNAGAGYEQRSPCDERQCGCQGGIHCWTHCQCETLANKLKWARRNEVRPPRVALERAERQGLDISIWHRGTNVPPQNGLARTIRTKTPAAVAKSPIVQPKKSCCGGCCCQQKQAKPRPVAHRGLSLIHI